MQGMVVGPRLSRNHLVLARAISTLIEHHIFVSALQTYAANESPGRVSGLQTNKRSRPHQGDTNEPLRPDSDAAGKAPTASYFLLCEIKIPIFSPY